MTSDLLFNQELKSAQRSFYTCFLSIVHFGNKKRCARYTGDAPRPCHFDMVFWLTQSQAVSLWHGLLRHASVTLTCCSCMQKPNQSSHIVIDLREARLLTRPGFRLRGPWCVSRQVFLEQIKSQTLPMSHVVMRVVP